LIDDCSHGQARETRPLDEDAGPEQSLDELGVDIPRAESLAVEIAREERRRGELDGADLWAEQCWGAQLVKHELIPVACYDTGRWSAQLSR
jgi:hypothetical protein